MINRFITNLLIGFLLIIGFSPELFAQTSFSLWRYRTHASDCTALTDGRPQDICKQLTDGRLFVCNVAASNTCDTPAEWIESSGGGWVDYGTTVGLRTSGDNVGIGTNAASSKLEVEGAVTADSFIADGTSEINFEPNDQNLRSDKDGWINTNGGIAVGTSDPTATLEVKGNGNTNATNSFIARNASGTQVMHIGDSGLVGIGTTASNIPLSVKGSGSFFPEVRVWKENASTNTAESMMDFFRQSSGTAAIGLGQILRFYIEDDANVSNLAYSISPETTDATNGSYDALVREAMTENGTLKTQWIKRSNGFMAFNLNDNGNIVPNAPVDIFGDGSTTGWGLVVRSNPPVGTIRFLVQDSGNVGIGTWVPSSSLNIVKSGSTDLMRISSIGGAGGDYLIVNSSGNVGVGTPSPSTKFHVLGGARITGLVSCDTIDTDANGVLSCGTDSGGGGGVGVGTVNPGTSGYIAYYPSTGTTVDDVSALFFDGTNIGIGTTTTTAKVTVIGGIAASGSITGSNLSGTNTGDQTNVTGNSGTVTFADAGGDTTTFVALGTSSTGSLSPATDSGLTYNATTDALSSTTFIGALTGNASTATALAADPSGCSAGDYVSDIAANGTLTCSTPAGGSGANGWTDGGTNVYLSTTTDTVGIGTTTPILSTLSIVKQGTTNPLRISSSATQSGDYLTISSAGNIGIGTNFASTKIYVKQTANTNLDGMLIANSGLTGSMRFWVDGSNNGRIDNTFSANTPILINGAGGGNVGIGTQNARAFLDFAAPSAPASPFSMNSSGNVGIGSLAPRGRLDVGAGDIYAGSIFAGTESTGQLSNSSGIGFDANSLTYTTPELYITPSGNVGVGTISPDSLWTVASTGYPQFKITSAGAPTSTDCDSDAERGRMVIDTTNNRLYICNGASRAWDYVTLTD